MMDSSEKYLSIFQHQNSLKLVDCKLCQDEAPCENSIPKLLSNQHKISSYMQEINKFFGEYLQEKLTTKDFRLLKGVISNEDLAKDEFQNTEIGKIHSIHEDSSENKDDFNLPEINTIEYYTHERPNVLTKEIKSSNNQ